MINYYLLLNVNGIQNRGLKMVTSKFTEILLFIYTVIEKKHRQRLVCCAGRQTDHYSRRNPRPETHGVGAAERQS